MTGLVEIVGRKVEKNGPGQRTPTRHGVGKYIGAHVSIAGGVENAPLRAAALGANAFAMFTANQRQWRPKPLTPGGIVAFQANLEEVGISPDQVLVHDSYLINLGNPEREKRDKSVAAFIEEARRVEALGLTLLNFHPGSHLGKISPETCMDYIAQGIQKALAATERVVFVLETTAGQGSSLGSTFAELAAIMERVGRSERIGVCIDTCHLYAAGYDLVAAYDAVLAEFDATIGFDRLRGVHLNDCKSSCGRRLDRHHSLGAGTMGWGVFARLMADPRLDTIPLVLETIDPARWPLEIARLRELAAGNTSVACPSCAAQTSNS